MPDITRSLVIVRLVLLCELYSTIVFSCSYKSLDLTAVTSLCAAVVLGVNANFIWTTMNTRLNIDGIALWPQTSVDPFAALNVAVAVLSLVTVPVM